MDISSRDRHSCLSLVASETSLTGRNACRYPLLPLKSQMSKLEALSLGERVPAGRVRENLRCGTKRIDWGHSV